MNGKLGMVLLWATAVLVAVIFIRVLFVAPCCEPCPVTGGAVVVEVDTVVIEPGDTVVIEPGDTVVIEPGDTVLIEPGDTVIIKPGG